jgi:hypothetical protein
MQKYNFLERSKKNLIHPPRIILIIFWNNNLLNKTSNNHKYLKIQLEQ